MTDYYAVLKKAISGLEHESGEVRRSVYDKARTALIGQLKSIQPPLTTSEISRQRLELEEAIRKVEREAAVTAAGPVPARARAAAAAAAVANALSVEPDRPDEEPETFETADDAFGEPAEYEYEPEPEPEPEPPPPPPRASPRVPVRPGEVPRQAAPQRPVPPTRALPDATVPIHVEAVDEFYDEPEIELPAEQAPPRQQPGSSPQGGRQAGPRQEAARPDAPRVAPWVPQIDPAEPPSRGRQASARREPPFPSEPRFPIEPSFGPSGDEAPAVDPAGEWQETFDEAPAVDNGFAEEVRERGRRPMRGGRGKDARQDSRNDDGFGGERQRRSRLPALILLILVGLIIGGVAAFAWSQRAMVEDVIGDLISKSDAPGDKAAPESEPGGASGKNADRLGGAPPEEAPRAVRTVDAGPAPDEAMAPMAPAADASQPAEPDAVAPAADSPAPDDGALPGVEPTAPAAAPDAGASDQALVAQRAILYEQPTAGGTAVAALNGTVVWKFDGNSSNGPEIQAQVDVPERKMKVTVNIRKNTDSSLPASHLVEVIIDTPSDFPGGSIKSVPAFVMKPTEEARGQPLDGAPAKVADGFFWIAFSSDAAPMAQNIALLRERNWIDIPLIYDNDQRAILTLEKGAQGQKAFADALAAWGN